MTWPTPPSSSALPSDQLDNLGDSPAGARDQLLQLKARVDELNAALVAVINNGEPVLADGSVIMTGHLTLAGNAVDPLHGVPKQQLPKVTALRLSSDIVGGSGECLFDVGTRDDGDYWNQTTKALSTPTVWGTVVVNLTVRAHAGGTVERIFSLISEGQVKSEVRKLIGSAFSEVHLTYTGKLSGTIQVVVNSTSITFSSFGGTTNLGLVVFP